MNENLKMSLALLSRFDLVFILLDRPDELLDKRVSDHIMAVRSSISFECYSTYHVPKVKVESRIYLLRTHQ